MNNKINFSLFAFIYSKIWHILNFDSPVAVWYLENLRRERSCRRVKVFKSPSRGCVRQSVTPSRQILQPVLDDYCRQNVPFVTSCCVSTTSSLPSPKKFFFTTSSPGFLSRKRMSLVATMSGTFRMMYLIFDIKIRIRNKLETTVS